MIFADSHTHLDSEDYADDRDEMISRAFETGVKYLITIGAGDGSESAKRAVKLAEKYPYVWAVVGIHPHDAGKPHEFSVIEDLANHPRVVGIGETGIDLFKEWSPFPDQIKSFEKHIELALKVKKPLVIHCRDAADKCLEVLQSTSVADVGGVFHCFSEDADFARKLWEINFRVSFPGILTFKKSEQMRNTAALIPIEQILLETDAPFLAPEPYRGKRCESAFIIETARCLAKIKNLPLATIAETTTKNTLSLFLREVG